MEIAIVAFDDFTDKAVFMTWEASRMEWFKYKEPS